MVEMDCPASVLTCYFSVCAKYKSAYGIGANTQIGLTLLVSLTSVVITAKQ